MMRRPSGSEVAMAEVETSGGALRGTREAGVEVFRGIPYARPPVGPLRLRPPQPAEPWRGARDATRFGAAQPQREGPLDALLGLVRGARIDEDCLTLNVFTPAADGAARPVLVWLHGGAFIGGTACVPLYDGKRLAARGDVVVVTLNYRVGALGMSFAPGDGDVANLGLRDQIAALRWVRREIGSFGGDPRRVTIFGESAGAGSALALAGMPEAEELFAGAIVQSAAPRGVLTAEEGAARTETVRAKLGAAGRGLDALREATVEALLDAQYACAAAGPHRTGMFYAPVEDGRTLATAPIDAFATGWARRVPLVIGTTRDEMRLFDAALPDSEDVVRMVVSAQLDGVAADARDAASRELLAVHREALATRGAPTTARDLFYAVQTELSLRYHATRIADARAPGRNTWMYLFDWESPARGGIHGACHALDLPFAFGNLDAPGMREFAGEGGAPQRLAEQMMDAWCAFARSGDPSHDGVGAWPAYEPSRRATLALGTRCAVVDAPCERERAALERVGYR
jgi:para-nitrobenzyl esterase